MAKQTFTTGQVLTAAQMTSLQQTAMGGGATTAKTASYVLTAADAGTVVQMNAAGATTITVNTALFAAGDTVFIQNIGAGSTTVTAGTATVNTAGSLIVPQYDAGILYFVSASSAIFYDYVQTSSSGLAAASQAEMEAASSNTVAATPANAQYHPSAAKFWIKFNGTGTPAINASYNFTSITDSGTGYYELYIATDFSSGNYCVVASSTKLSGASGDTTIMMASPVGAYSAGNFGLITSNLAGTLSDSEANFVVGYGDQ
jgi:hypothetical protein